MKLFTMCMKCQAELGHPSFEPLFVDYFDDAVAHIECSKGHKSALLIQSLKFEMLLESGANAFLEGFTLEACAAFSAALERFYEFSLHVIALARGMSEEVFQKMFTEMARQSERQIGAFMMLYAIEFGEPYKADKSITEFRNGVIHKGIIPNLEEAAKFCDKVYGKILDLYKQLSSKFQEQIHQVVRHELREKHKRVPAELLPAGTAANAMFFKIAQPNNPDSFTAALEAFRKERALISGALPYMQALHKLIKAHNN